MLHYLFFYAMNDWRSTFHGANDHEADWEQMFVYLYEDGQGELVPRWVACASHDYYGDNLRRRWDDPLLARRTDCTRSSLRPPAHTPATSSRAST